MSASNDHNRRAWDRMVQEKDRFARPAKDEDFREPLRTVDGLGWLGGDIRAQKVLCLAAGGGRQSALYAAAGAEVTVVDISSAMLELDREVALQRDLSLRTVETSMDDLSMFRAGEFDIVIQPVSTCYVPDVVAVFRQVARVVRDEGLYISQHKQPASLQAHTRPTAAGGYELTETYYRQGPLPSVAGSRHREQGTLEYLHRWEQLLGGMCRVGFVIEDLVEPMHAKVDADGGSFAHRCQYVAPYVRVKARRRTRTPQTPSPGKQRIWTPAG